MTLGIEVGDVVRLRQIRFNQLGEVLHNSTIIDHKGKPVQLPYYSDTQHDSVVWNIDRLQEKLYLRLDNLIPASMLFNVQFTVQSDRLGALYKATITAQHLLEEPGDCWMRSMLFPKKSNGHHQKTLNKAKTSLSLYDPLLNYEQSRAVEAILKGSYGVVPYLISGPPGTGKTKTTVELALQLVGQNDSAHILVCAPSDSAADTLVQRLSTRMTPTQLLRVNAPSRSFPEVPDTVLPYCRVQDGVFTLPPFRQLMRTRIVVTTCRDADILLQARVSNSDLINLELGLSDALHPGLPQSHPRLHWTALLIDEAAQATEAVALIPLSVIAPPGEQTLGKQSLPSFVMAGDQHQLGPRTASKTASMQTSLFERLMDRPFYREHPLARSKQSGGVMRPLTQAMLPIIRPAFTNLIRNYRSHPAILATPNQLFYDDTVDPEAADTDSLLRWTGWKGPPRQQKWPVLFATNLGSDEVEQDGGGWYNISEARTACAYAHDILSTGLLQPEDLCIMSPFRAQVRILRNIARKPPYAMSAVNIGPLEAFQGLEFRFVIVCTTRTRDRFLDQDRARGLGVIHEPKRFNVALTRAKQGLVVIGNPHVLAKDANWQAFLAFCHRNGLWEDKAQAGWRPAGVRGGEVSRLERQLLYGGRLSGAEKQTQKEGSTSAVTTSGAEKQTQKEGSTSAVTTSGAKMLGLSVGEHDEEDDLWQSGLAAAEQILGQRFG